MKHLSTKANAEIQELLRKARYDLEVAQPTWDSYSGESAWSISEIASAIDRVQEALQVLVEELRDRDLEEAPNDLDDERDDE